MKSTLERLKECNDLNDVTMAHEDGTQVRHTRSSWLDQSTINTLFKQQKSESQLEQIYIENGKNGVKTE